MKEKDIKKNDIKKQKIEYKDTKLRERNLVAEIEYKGTRYSGFQKQPNRYTVEEALLKAIKDITGEKPVMYASGRTDRGVHAMGQIISFKVKTKLPAHKWRMALNFRLVKNNDKDIAAKRIWEEASEFNALGDCKSKTYIYVINDSYESGLFKEYEHFYPYKLDVNKMNKACQFIIGKKDFKAFKNSGGDSKTTIREIYDASVERKNDRVIIKIKGDGFLYNMVRIIAGTLRDVGVGKITSEDVDEILKSKDRKKAGHTLPAEGLYLYKAEYKD